MDDELENFIRERKARMAEDKASLGHDPPYMEIKAKPHRAYESTAKENIPPRSKAQEKEESCTAGLPLGVEYERKKQRLRHELRMDYRRYMAQKKHFGPAEPGTLIHLNNRRSIQQHLLEGQADAPSRQRPPSRRDVATLTEDTSGSHRPLRLRAEILTLGPEADEEQKSVPLRHWDRLGKPLDWEQEEEEEEEEEEEDFKELELGDRRRRKHIGVEACYENRPSNKTDWREKNENLVGGRSRALTNNEDVEFATGLKIGSADTEDALQRRKERYRHELQEQIAEQHRNKKREKDLELKVAATGANDPEKQPDRIRQFGLCRKQTHQGMQPSGTGVSESPSRGLPSHVRVGFRVRETPLPPPELPHVAFQSPLLEYSSSLSLSPNSQPAAPSFPRATDTPRIPLFPPRPPSALGEAYRSLYGEPHHNYNTRNLLDPNMAYLSSYWNVPAGGAPPSQFGSYSPHSQHSGSTFLEPPPQPSSEASAVDAHIRVLPSERSGSTRDRVLNYREALKQQAASSRGNSELYNQIKQQQEQRRLEKEDEERYEAQLEADMKNHQPWGRGGGGAPLRDGTGNLIADLHQMHKLNEEAYMNPEQWQRRATATRRPEPPSPNQRVSGSVAECSSHLAHNGLSGSTHNQTQQFARGSVFSNQPTPQQLHEQDKYKAYLQQQIDEKLLKKAEERERTRLEEEKEEKRLAEQRARIQREFDEEQERKKRKEMEQKAKNEELIELTERRKKEMERKKNEAEEKERAALRKQYERERQARVEKEVCREPSPPIPTLQKRHGLHQYTPTPPTVDRQHSTAPLSEGSLSGLQSPPVPARKNQLRAAGDQRDVFSELSALRRHLRNEEKRLEGRLQQVDWEELDSPLSDRHRERPQVDVFDMARLRLQAPVRRPNSRHTEPRNLLRLHDSLQLNNFDDESRLGFMEVLKQEEVGVASRRRRDYMDQQFSSRGSTVQDDYCNLSPPQHNDYLRSVIGRSARGSLLDSESAFIDPLGEALPARHTPEADTAAPLSARERRRMSKRPQNPQENNFSSRHFSRQDDYSALTGDGQEVEPGGQRGSRHGSGRLMSISRRSKAAGPVAFPDDTSSPTQFSLHRLDCRGPLDRPSMDPWMPGTTDTLKCLSRPPRRERLIT